MDNYEQQSFADALLGSTNPMADDNGDTQQGAIISSAPYNALQGKVQALENSSVQTQLQVHKLQGVLAEVTHLNGMLYKYVGDLNARIIQLERGNVQLGSHVENEGEAEATGASAETTAKDNKGIRSDLDQSPSAVMGDNRLLPAFPDGLPTPITPVAKTTLAGESIEHSMDTPISQTPTTPGGTQKPRTMLYKSMKHNLANIIPHAGTQIPVIPLTDKELIVFFFNSLQRPIVSLRLYGRNWGPSQITCVLNAHREIKPEGYKKNTTSVKCSKAIKRGQQLYGNKWYDQWKKFFLESDDADATDAIRLSQREIDADEDGNDYMVMDCLHSLKKLPVDDNNEKAIFTKSVEWCVQNDVNIPLSLIHKVAIALEHDLDPGDSLAAEDLVDDALVDVDVVESRKGNNTKVTAVAGTVSSELSDVDEDLLADADPGE
ncbi:hypothetical protein K458DRAFT_389140 [Lentithecium fluviatile CBS 122367]|uniref:Uncharacterized protein n=1 Tax=Lentithecium fluviatile CBS 122367 TaxID=1168545 RepID=A0A6G1J0K4_9PLEO|nr:hypothetical protein K458DRAFT_389140 [Lentithecium fluviatile CBS 122367]